MHNTLVTCASLAIGGRSHLFQSGSAENPSLDFKLDIFWELPCRTNLSDGVRFQLFAFCKARQCWRFSQLCLRRANLLSREFPLLTYPTAQTAAGFPPSLTTPIS